MASKEGRKRVAEGAQGNDEATRDEASLMVQQGASAGGPPSTAPVSQLEYERVKKRVWAAVRGAVAPDATVLVVSRGDDELLEFDGRRGWHFPRSDTGEYAGHHPADSAEAISHLEDLRAQGAGFFVIPGPSLWWLDHYRELTRHLEASYEALVREPATCVIFHLGKAQQQGTMVGDRATRRTGGPSGLAKQIRTLAGSLLPSESTVLVVNQGNPHLLELEQRAWPFPGSRSGTNQEKGGVPPDALSERLRDLQSAGAQFLIVPCDAGRWLEECVPLRAELAQSARPIVRREYPCDIYELGWPESEEALAPEVVQPEEEETAPDRPEPRRTIVQRLREALRGPEREASREDG